MRDMAALRPDRRKSVGVVVEDRIAVALKELLDAAD
jgi:hypothetical protein